MAPEITDKEIAAKLFRYRSVCGFLAVSVLKGVRAFGSPEGAPHQREKLRGFFILSRRNKKKLNQK